MQTKVRDILTPGVTTVQLETPLQDVARRLVEDHAGVVVVLDDKSAPAGIITDAELFPKARKFGFTLHLYSLFGAPVELDDLRERYESASQSKARDVMCSHLNSLEIDSDLRELMAWMLERDLRRVVITDKGQLVGVVTRADIVSRLLGAKSSVHLQKEGSQV